ncbi:MAG: bifunctional DNA primase/polymerase [Planctomycetes bacterium]|nr:bifunctional DNA primase/polymerase [Planctomycetota bacterium]
MLDLTDLPTAARYYAELGYPVFPCIPGTKKPLTKHGFRNASTNLDRVEAWWTEHPQANIGIATDGLLILDIDGRDNPWLKGDERLAKLACGPVSITPRGGVHHVFRQPKGKAWRCTQSSLAPFVDTRADGGYFMAPPSQAEGDTYRWQPTFVLTEPPDKLPEPPAWLVEMLDTLPDEERTPTVAGNPIPTGQRNATLARLAGTMRRAGMTQAEMLAALSQANQDRCQPPLESAEVQRVALSIARYAPDEITVALIEDHYGQTVGRDDATLFSPAHAICQTHPRMRTPVIHGLLREGETMNVIAAPKAGKSWLVHDLALSVATGKAWLGYPVEAGRVLHIDNELHTETLASRIKQVSQAMPLNEAQWRDAYYVRSMRGQLEDLFRMEAYFNALPESYFKLIILDAFYRFMPREMDENDNGTMANLYNLIDRFARRLRVAFVLIHHTTKGVQSGKSVTDVGAGAGAQSRAADCHLVLRPHQQDGCLVVEAVTRSWPSPMPFVIRQAFPLWHPDPALDPADLKKPDDYARNRPSKRESPQEAEPEFEDEWTLERFVAAFVGEEPRMRASIQAAANGKGMTDHQTGKLLEKSEACGLVHRWTLDRNRAGYATRPQPRLLPEQPQ